MSAREAEWVAVDFETTGVVEGHPDEPWQVGMVRVRGGIIIDQFESLLQVGDRPFNPYAPGRHHALRVQLRDAPRLDEIWPQLNAWWGGTLVAHNASTEQKVMKRAAPMHDFGPWLDTLKLARVAWPERASHKLEDLTADMGLDAELATRFPGRDAHDALYDAMASALLLVRLLQYPGWEEVSVADLARAHPERFHKRR